MRTQNKYNLFLFILLLNFISLIVSAPSFADVTAELVNKVIAPEEGPVSFEVGNVKIKFSNGNSKLLSYKTNFNPLVVKNKVYIINTDGNGCVTELIIYNTIDNQVTKYPLPADINTMIKRCFCSPSFSPDGKKIAYYLVLKDERGKVIVRSFPDGNVLKESQIYRMPGTDVPPAIPNWKDSMTVEFEGDIFYPPLKVIFSLGDNKTK